MVSGDGKVLEFDEQPSGIVALNRANFDYLVSSRREFAEQLIEAKGTISSLRERLIAAETAPAANAVPDMTANYKLLSELLLEKQELLDRFAKTKEDTALLQSEVAESKKIIDSYKADYDSLLGDYDYVEKLHFRTVTSLDIKFRRFSKCNPNFEKSESGQRLQKVA